MRPVVRLSARIRTATKALLGLRLYPTPAQVKPRFLEEQAYQAIVEEGQIVYDIGANAGTTALFLARLAGPRGLVLAFEPVMPTYRQLCATIQMDVYAKAPICTIPLGVGDQDAVVTMSVPNDQSAMASISLSSIGQDVAGARGVESRSCQFVRLDSFVRQFNLPKPDFVKIDVEGAELLVLEGARTLLETALPIIHMEVFAPWERTFGYGPYRVFSILQPLGYQFLFACPGGIVEHVPTEGEPFPSGFEHGYNVIALHSQRHAASWNKLKVLRMGADAILPVPPAPVQNRLSP